jgi:hypothetical protein
MTAEGTTTRVEERVGQAATTSREEAANVTETVQSEVKDVAQKAKTQAESALHQMVDDVRAQAEGQASKIAETMHHASSELRSMADAGEPKSVATTLIREGADAAERLAEKLEDGGIDGALAEVRSFARRSPGVFLLGAAAAGVAAGRLMRNFSAASTSDPLPSEPSFRPSLDLTAASAGEGSPQNGSPR